MTFQLSKRLLAATCMTAVMGTAGVANAGFISIEAENFVNAGDAWTAMQNYRSGQKAFAAEDFQSFTSGDTTVGEPGGELVTNVGRFAKGAGAVNGDTNGACSNFIGCESPAILNGDDTPFGGRFNTTDGNSGDDSLNWLDSMDVSEVTWKADLSTDDIDLGSYDKITSIAVILTDVTDVGATFEFELEDGTGETASFDLSGLGNGSFTFVTAKFQEFAPPVTAFTATFANVSGNIDGDGFGIDDATISVPVPSTLALLGAGLVMAGFASRGRRQR